MGLAGIGAGILIVGLAPASQFSLAVAGMLTAGVMSSLCNGPIMAIFQATVSPSMQGRVFTLVGSATAAMMPLGLAFAGPLADIIGVRTWFLIGGLITIIAAVSGFFIPALINIELERDDHTEIEGDALISVPLAPLMERSDNLQSIT